jgi:alpha-beta hydrolase superfamily lysophospholipase
MRWAGLGLGLGLGLGTGVQAQVERTEWVRVAEAFVAHLAAGRYDAAAAMVGPAVPVGALDAERLRAIWGQLHSQAGEYRGATPRSEAEQQGLRIVELDAAFERQGLIIRVVLDGERRLSGLWFGPAPPPAVAEGDLPPYADVARIVLSEVTVGSAPWALPGTLALPAGDGKVPVVVLVHGSGPHDRDETIGPNRPFRDLALGLATAGVGVLRYEKRTKAHGARMGVQVTVEEEVIEDALAAVALARSHARAEGVYLLGHSLGGMLAPEIARRDGALAGVVLWAAPARGFATLMAEQLEYIGSLPESAGAEDQRRLRALLDTVALLESRSLAPDVVVMGALARYVYDLDARDPVGVAGALDVPLLVLQGGRDYQVTMEDFELWRRALGGGRAAFRVYPDLNHLFIPGRGRATPQEYMTHRGVVAAEVVRDVAAWIRTGRLD